MNITALAFLVVNATAVMTLRREWAPIPLLATCCYMTTGQGIELGAISLPVYRLVLAAGFLRVVMRGERLVGGLNAIDKLMFVWASWMILASLFHEWQAGSGPVYASGFVYNIMLVYLLTRIWCRDLSELVSVLRIVAWLLVPVAAAMVAEHVLYTNLFAVFGGVSEQVYIRDGAVRAQGPFAHPILAGTVGAGCLPLLVALWQRYRVSALVGLVACVVMVIASSSSGPIMSLIFGALALMMWSYRRWLSVARWALIGAYVSAEILMSRPAYYLMSKIDLTGSSTGWHRSRLIEVALQHVSEWWAFGTDYTAHWMGITVDDAGKHSDITNYYLWIGIIGGLPATLLLIAVVWRGFVWVGTIVRNPPSVLKEHQFTIWCLGCGLFVHACTSISVSYTDQSMMFWWLTIGVISSVYSIATVAGSDEKNTRTRAAVKTRQIGVGMNARRYFRSVL